MSLFQDYESYRKELVAQAERSVELAARLQEPCGSFEHNLNTLRHVPGVVLLTSLTMKDRQYMSKVSNEVQALRVKQKLWTQEDEQMQLRVRREAEITNKLNQIKADSTVKTAQLHALVSFIHSREALRLNQPVIAGRKTSTANGR